MLESFAYARVAQSTSKIWNLPFRHFALFDVPIILALQTPFPIPRFYL